MHITLCTCVSVLLAHIARSEIAVSKGSFMQKHLVGVYCVLRLFLVLERHHGQDMHMWTTYSVGDISSFYLMTRVYPNPLAESGGVKTPWTLPSVRSSGSMAGTATGKCVEETEIKHSTGDHRKIRGRAGHVGYLVNRIGRIYLAVMQSSNRCKRLLDKGVELSIHGLMTGLGARVEMRVKNGTVLCQMYLCWPQTWNGQLWGKAVGSLFKTKHCGCWGTSRLPTRSPR